MATSTRSPVSGRPIRRHQRRQRVLSVVDIDHVSPALARKFGSTVTNAMHSRPEGSADISAHVDYDTDRAHLRIVIHGEPTETANLLGLVAIWSAQLTP